MKTENLRNKYKNHPIIQPIIEYCEDNRLGFELIKETIPGETGMKSIGYHSFYYMKIGDSLVTNDRNLWGWNDLFKLIIKAYNYLGLEYPENLVKAAKNLKKQI